MTQNEIAESCARAAHDAIGDARSPAWRDLTDAQRFGVIAGAHHALNGGSPADSHALWMKTRVAEGWTYGPAKDFAAKTSPCLVPYEELPETQRRKDALFQSVVRAMAEALS
jgi:RyR domain